MIRLLILISAISSSAVFAASRNGRLTLPDPILALQANPGFAAALVTAQQNIEVHRAQVMGGLEAKHILLLGVSLQEDAAVIDVGAPNGIWPTSIYKTGEIRAHFRDFPDGVNGILITDTPVFVEQATPTRYP